MSRRCAGPHPGISRLFCGVHKQADEAQLSALSERVIMKLKGFPRGMNNLGRKQIVYNVQFLSHGSQCPINSARGTTKGPLKSRYPVTRGLYQCRDGLSVHATDMEALWYSALCYLAIQGC